MVSFPRVRDTAYSYAPSSWCGNAAVWKPLITDREILLLEQCSVVRVHNCHARKLCQDNHTGWKVLVLYLLADEKIGSREMEVM